MKLYYGVVENRLDPLKLGRCQVRVIGLHTHDKAVLPTSDLPWATPMQPVTSAAMNGIGWTPVGPVEGATVIITFADADNQQPIMLGTLGGIPQSKAAILATEDSGNIATDGGVVTTPDGTPVKKSDGTTVTIGNAVESELNKVTSNIDQGIQSIKNKIQAAAAAAFGKSFGDLFGTPAGEKKMTINLPVQGAADEKAPTIVPPKPQTSDTKITAQPEPGKADPVVLNTPINLEPMPKYVKRGEEGKAKQGVAALVSACDKVGLTSKYAKASILAICGGESGWVPKKEGYVYPADRLLSIFPSIFNGDKSLADQYSSGKVSREEFFELIYGHKYPKGRGLGNKDPGDGGKYYGRGFNQLTGKSGYLQAQNELKKYGINVDLIGNPELLNDDINVAALACVIFYKKNVSHPQDDPGYFVAARNRTGANAGSGYEKKQVMYEYFLGQSVLATPTTRPAVDDEVGKKYTKEEVAYLPKEKQDALLEDRSENATVGFKDPKGKYPLRNLLNEPDTNRLARGIIQDTAIAYKDQIRTTGIPAPFGGSWEQPIAPFGGQYPYSKVYETESGHIMIFDDTTGHETVSLYHRKGSSIDFDANGTQVNKIVGDGYTIYDRNGFIYVTGRCNLTVGNSVNILVQGDANIEVNGQTQAVFHNQVDIGCASDVNLAVGGDFNIKVEGDMNTTVAGDSNLYVSGDSNQKILGAVSSDITGAMNVKATGAAYIESADAMHVVGNETKVYSKSNLHLKSDGNIYADGTAFRSQEGLAIAADNATTTGVEKSDLDVPSTAEGISDKFENLTTPVRPAPPAEIKANLLDEYLKECEHVSYDKGAEEMGAGAAASRPQPKTNDDPPSVPPQQMADGDLVGFLRKQLDLAKEGYWSEKAMLTGEISDSNPNIVAMWKDIGMYNILKNKVPEKSGKGYASGGDQTAWCMAFVNHALKQSGYKWCQTARAADITSNPAKWNATKVDTPQNGDILHVKFHNGGNHVAFVWDVQPNGKFSMLGGNQGGSGGGNNPSAGTVSVGYKNILTTSGWNSPKGGVDVVGIYRPSKT